MEKVKRLYLITAILLVVSIAYIIMVKTIDVKAIGPVNPETGVQSEVGFATMNDAARNMIGESHTWYKITKYSGYAALLLAAGYGIYGFIELLKKKSIFKVDKRIITLGAFYVVVLAIYVLFELWIVNYRPVLEESGELEASFPSSHTVLAICVCGSSLFVSKYFIKNKNIKKIIDVIALVLLVVTLGGRIISGVHWMSDIIGGIIISAYLLMAVYSVLKTIDYKESK